MFPCGIQYFEPLQSYTKPEGPHPLDIQQLNPIYIWLVCLASFFMLIAGNGMVELYGQVAGSEYLAMSQEDLRYQKQKVANGLGSITLLIILIKILDKVYYRERLLPSFLFNWLNKFYQDVENHEENEKLKKTLNNIDNNQLERRDSEDSDYSVNILTLATTNSHNIQNNNHNNETLEEKKDDNIKGKRKNSTELNNSNNIHNSNNMHINSLSTTSKQIILHDNDYMNSRSSLNIISKSHLAMGIRRIRPLTVLRIIISGIQFILWTVDSIATSDYMTYFALLIVFPSLVEVILEVRNFIRKEYGSSNDNNSSSSVSGSNIGNSKVKGSSSKSNLEVNNSE